MTVYLTPPNRYGDLAHPRPHDPPIDVGVELDTWRKVRLRWLGHARAVGETGCPECSDGQVCTELRAYGKTLSGILHRATQWGPSDNPAPTVATSSRT